MQNIVLNLINRYHGNWDDVYNAIAAKRKDSYRPHLEFTFPKDINKCFIAYQDDYPDKLKDILLPPFFVFWKGNIKLLDGCVLGFPNSLSLEDYDFLTAEQTLSTTKYTLCFKSDDIEQHTVINLISKGFNVILICNGGFNNLDFSHELKVNKLLLISEFWDTSSYEPAEEQTIERLVFALSNELYINTTNSKIVNKVLSNYERKYKPIYFQPINKQAVLKFDDKEIECSYVKNLQEVLKLK